MRLSRRVLVTMASVLIAGRAWAAWPALGVVVARPTPPYIAISEARLIPCPGGGVVALGSGTTASSEYWDSRYVTAGGDVGPSWPGILTLTLGTNAVSGGPGVLPKIGTVFTSAGDLATSWANGDATVYQERIIDYATPAPTHLNRSFTNPLGWVPSFTALAPATGNDVYVYYGGNSVSSRLTRRAADGSVSPGWPVNGKRVFTSVYGIQGALLPDGTGGVIVSEWNSALEIRVTRLAADTTFAPGWSASGLLLGTPAINESSEQHFPMLLPSGASGYLAAWDFQPTETSRQFWMRRFLSDGTVDAAWPAGGVKISFTSSTFPRFQVIPDGSGGAFVLFERDHEPRGTHILETGVVDPAIGAADAPLLDPGALYIPERDTLSHAKYRVPLVACPGKSGGLIFVWTDGRNAPQGTLRARWLTSALQPDPSEPATPRAIPTSNASATNVRAAVPDGFGGLYVAWEDLPAGEPSLVLVLNRVLASEFLAAPPAARPSAIALSTPRPNPARSAVSLEVTLPDDAPARVELLDVAGRVLRSQVVGGAGAHDVSFGELGALAPGLYFVRARGPGGTHSTRLVVSR